MLVILGLTLACFSTKAESLFSSRNTQDEVIPLIIENTGVDPHSPRAPAHIPIICYLDEFNGHICFSFSYPLGDVTIILTEAIAGVVSADEYSSSSGVVSVSIPEPGVYNISLIIESGAEYIGYFIY